MKKKHKFRNLLTFRVSSKNKIVKTEDGAVLDIFYIIDGKNIEVMIDTIKRTPTCLLYFLQELEKKGYKAKKKERFGKYYYYYLIKTNQKSIF